MLGKLIIVALGTTGAIFLLSRVPSSAPQPLVPTLTPQLAATQKVAPHAAPSYAAATVNPEERKRLIDQMAQLVGIAKVFEKPTVEQQLREFRVMPNWYLLSLADKQSAAKVAMSLARLAAPTANTVRFYDWRTNKQVGSYDWFTGKLTVD